MISTYTTADERETKGVAHALADRLPPGTVVGLRGALGAGKTVFAKGLAEALQVGATVTSQSYTLIAEYEGVVPFYHADLYRIGSAGELDNLGLEEYFDRGGVTVIEWYDRAPSALPAGAVVVTIELLSDDRRRITIEEPECAF